MIKNGQHNSIFISVRSVLLVEGTDPENGAYNITCKIIGIRSGYFFTHRIASLVLILN